MEGRRKEGCGSGVSRGQLWTGFLGVAWKQLYNIATVGNIRVIPNSPKNFNLERAVSSKPGPFLCKHA